MPEGDEQPTFLRSQTQPSNNSNPQVFMNPFIAPFDAYGLNGNYDEAQTLYSPTQFPYQGQAFYQPNPATYQQPVYSNYATYQPVQARPVQHFPQQPPVGSYLSPGGVPVFLPIIPTTPNNVDTLHVVISDYSSCDRRDLYEVFSSEPGFQRLAFQTDGYSFVKFDNNEVAVASLQRMRDRMLQGDTKIIGLKVGLAKCSYVPNYRIPAGPDQYPPSPTLHLSHFPRDATVLELRRFFSVFEGFDRLVYHINYAHVLFTSVEHASTAKTIVNNTTNFITAFAKNIQGMTGPVERPPFAQHYVPEPDHLDQTPVPSPASRMPSGTNQDPIRDIAWLVAQLQNRDPNLAAVLKQLQQSATGPAPAVPTGRYSPGRSPSYRPAQPTSSFPRQAPTVPNPAPGPMSHEHLQRLLAQSQSRGDDWNGSTAPLNTYLGRAPNAETARPRSESHDSGKSSGSGGSVKAKPQKTDILPSELLSNLLDNLTVKETEKTLNGNGSVSVPSSPFKSGWNSSVFGGFSTWAQDEKKTEKVSPSGSSPHEAMAREIAKNLFEDDQHA